ncbi:EAL domain-containing protein [Wenzhouxiangella limi]|uniref:EAL domain-containing protein n=1 Tax=Wenzhouxiangella limi TaxID=2707351 RepID=A0A845UVD6_9GAMM|nr:EAL domain-containing protein [Wenzhouxiangella limi]NDY95447.1 EAL domain-containing protein [Wenzhouxiangella limi]
MNQHVENPAACGGDLHDHIRQYQELVGSDIQFAFQTIIDARELEVIAFEALVRGLHGEAAATVISRVAQKDRFAFDQACRIRALEAAGRDEIDLDLHLNCAEIRSANIAQVCEVTHHMARRYRIDSDRIVLEIGGLERLGTRSQMADIGRILKRAGLRTLADNVGRHHADLCALAAFAPDQIKLDRALTGAVEQSAQRQAIVRGCQSLCRDLGIRLIAGGIETAAEFAWLQEAGVEYFQGFFFTQPDLDDGRR